MGPREALQKLKGSKQDKEKLFDELVSKAKETPLEDWEAGMLETIKKELFESGQVVALRASLKGLAGVKT